MTHASIYDLSRLTRETAARLPPAWDTPEHKQQIYSAFERFQICFSCGNARQAAQLLRILRHLTEQADARRLACLSEIDAQRAGLTGDRIVPFAMAS